MWRSQYVIDGLRQIVAISIKPTFVLDIISDFNGNIFRVCTAYSVDLKLSIYDKWCLEQGSEYLDQNIESNRVFGTSSLEFNWLPAPI